MPQLTTPEDKQSGALHPKPLRTRMLEGAGIIAFSSVFTMFVRPHDATIPVRTRLVMFILASLAGAAGGIFYYASDSWRARGGMYKTLANVGSIFAYCGAAIVFIGLWVWLTPQ